MKGNNPKVLMAKPGLDGHWRGIIVVSMALRDAGMEVVYGGNMTAAEIAEAAIQEDVDVVGLSILAPGHMRLISETLEALTLRGVRDIPVVVGGAIPEEDLAPLKRIGVLEIFRPGSDLADIVTFFRESLPKLSVHQRPLIERRNG
jgi:methylmalonyl-CoA mutase C-terminal domain/subunit